MGNSENIYNTIDKSYKEIDQISPYDNILWKKTKTRRMHYVNINNKHLQNI